MGVSSGVSECKFEIVIGAKIEKIENLACFDVKLLQYEGESKFLLRRFERTGVRRFTERKERMRRHLKLLCIGLFGCLAMWAHGAESKVEIAASPEQGSWGKTRLRGMNCYGSFTAQDFQDLKDWGVNHIRYQITNPQLVEENGQWKFNDRTKKSIDAVLELAKQVDIGVVLDLHAQGPFFPGDIWKAETLANWENPENRAKLVSLWKWIAETYKDDKTVIAYEILNEPAPPRNERGFRALGEINAMVTKAIREIDGWHTIVVSGPEFSRPGKMMETVVTGDPNTVYTFHMYEPTELTHQGISWMNAPAGVTYPGTIPLGWKEPRTPTMVDKDFLNAKMEPVVEFQRKYKVRIWVGEFACRRIAPNNSAYPWLKDVLEGLEAHSWDWAYHCFREDRYRTGTFSVEHNPDATKEDMIPSKRVETDRLKLLKSYFSQNEKNTKGVVAK